MEQSQEETISNDNNNAVANAPTVIVTTDCSSDLAAVGAGDGENLLKAAMNEPDNEMVLTCSRVQELLKNCDSGLSDGDASANSISDCDMNDSVDNSEVKIPSEELTQKIIKQVEFYFSDANVLKDTFLLKHIHRNKDGFVSLKLLTSFKKVKSLAKDYRVVAYCLKQSKTLVVNDKETKVRRIEPLPDYDDTIPSRSVVVVNIPSDNPTVDSIAKMFRVCGDIALIRILRPGKPVPQDVKKHANKHPEIGSTICAIIEFENHQFAKEACEKLSDDNGWRAGMRVALLAASKRLKKEPKKTGDENKSKNVTRKEKKTNPMRSFAQNNFSSGSENDLSQVDQKFTSRSESAITKNKQSQDNSNTGGNPRNQRRRNAYGQSKLAVGSDNSPRDSPETQRRKNMEQHSGGDSSPSSPWVQRRLKANQDIRSKSASSSPRGSPLLGRRFNGSTTSAPRMLDMSGVLRQPRGPDDTSGFAVGRGRGSGQPAP